MADERFWKTWEAGMFVLLGMIVMALLVTMAGAAFIVWGTP